MFVQVMHCLSKLTLVIPRLFIICLCCVFSSHLLCITLTVSHTFGIAIPEWEKPGLNRINVKHKRTFTTEVPHHVLVAYDNVYCSGSLIYSKIVLTVASCFLSGKNDRCSVKLGANTVHGLGEIIPVVERKLHEYYNYEVPLNNDIALLLLERSVTFNALVKKAILIEPDVAIRVGTSMEVAGWASINVGLKHMNPLLLTKMTVVSDEECIRVYGDLKTNSKYCGRYEPERCLSDNGGSAMIKNVLVGIVSYGATHTYEEKSVALFTNVSYFYRWIVLNSDRLLKKHCVEGPSDDNQTK